VKMLLYNEIIYVTKIILFIYQEHEMNYNIENKVAALNVETPPQNLQLDEGLDFWALQKDQDQDGQADNDIIEGLTIQKDILIDAWAVYKVHK